MILKQYLSPCSSVTLNDGGQEIQIVEVVVAEGIALGRRDARIGICEVLIGGTVTVGHP